MIRSEYKPRTMACFMKKKQKYLESDSQKTAIDTKKPPEMSISSGFFGARDGTRTHTPFDTRTSNVPVYLFQHSRKHRFHEARSLYPAQMPLSTPKRENSEESKLVLKRRLAAGGTDRKRQRKNRCSTGNQTKINIDKAEKAC